MMEIEIFFEEFVCGKYTCSVAQYIRHIVLFSIYLIS